MTLSAMAAPQNPSYPGSDIAEKVLRRAEIAKVARNLQDRLALANFKAQNGWQNRTLRAIEPEVTEQLRRKRPYSSGDRLSDASSTSSEEYLHDISSPLTGPAFSDDMPGSHHSRCSQLKVPSFSFSQGSGSHKRLRSSFNTQPLKTSTRKRSWKQKYDLPQSSPVFQRPQLALSNLNHSFVSDAATIPEPRHIRSSTFSSRTVIHDDEEDLPVYSFNHCQSSPGMVASSPLRTPSPTQHRIREPHAKETGADLLVYLANSPSRSPAIDHRPSHPTRRTVNAVEPPSTPPSQHNTTTNDNSLPSSFLSTPTTNATNNLALFSTPGQQFNFADFVNVTPSPAQAPWGARTPVVNKTPAATWVARRGLNFDALVPPPATSTTNTGVGSPLLPRGEIGGRAMKSAMGLALELGGNLMPTSSRPS